MKSYRCHTYAIFTGIVFLFGTVSISAADRPAAWLMTRGQSVADAELPIEALRGSGIASELNPAALGASSLRIPLSDGRVLRATRQRVVKDAARGRQSWIGTFQDQPGSLAVLSKARGVTTGFITYGAETFEIMPARGGRHMIYAVDPSKLPEADDVLLSKDIAADTSGTIDDGTGGTAADGGFVHDLLVVYTPASRTRYGQATLESKIVAAVAAANQAYLNSSVNITLNLVGLQEIDYTEAAYIADSLRDLRGTSDGKLDSVHALRDQFGADLVSLISENGGACGISYLMRTVSTDFASSAFNVVYSSCLSQHSLAHELGHNQGNMHDRANSGSTDGAFPYSHGLRRCVSDGTGFRTVMSYSCTGAPRVIQFSNPDVTYNGWPTGISYEADPANSADNVRSMNNTAETVAAFRAASTSTPPPPGGGSTGVPGAPTALTASATSIDSVSLTWADNSADESGFKVERSGNGVDFDEIASLGAGTTGFTDSGLTARMNYWYRVRAFNSAGHSDYSDTASVTMPGVVVAPSSLNASTTSIDSVSLTWADNSEDESGFKVERSGDGVDFDEIASLGTGTTGFTDTGLTADTTYWYRVRAFNGTGQSSYSNTASVTTLDVAPAPPAGIAARDNGDGSASVEWVDASANETGFEVRRETWDRRHGVWKDAMTAGSVPPGITGIVDVTGNGTFRYTVRALGSVAASGFVGPAQVSVTGGTKGAGKGRTR